MRKSQWARKDRYIRERYVCVCARAMERERERAKRPVSYSSLILLGHADFWFYEHQQQQQQPYRPYRGVGRERCAQPARAAARARQ